MIYITIAVTVVMILLLMYADIKCEKQCEKQQLTLTKLLDMDEKIAGIIHSSSLWNCGKDSHNALSELTISISDMIRDVIIEKEK